MARSDVLNALEDWVDAGLITQEQAEAIRERESATVEDALPGWVEPVAYLGTVLIGVALFLFGAEVWDQLSPWGRVALSGLITIVLFVVGLVMRRSHSDAATRAASFAWFLTVAGVAATGGLLFSDVMDLDTDWAPLLTSAIAALAAVVLYSFAQRTMQQIAIAASLTFLVATLPALLPLGDQAWIVGLLFGTVGAAWLLLTWADVLRPAATGWILGSLFAIGVGLGAVDDNAFWSVLGIVVGLGLVWLSTYLHRRSLLGLGVLALLIWIPTTVIILFEESIAVPVAILITGVVTLTVVVAGVRARPKTQEPSDGNGQR